MKIAFDEHVAPAIVRVFQVLSEEGFLLGYEFVSAGTYHDHANDPRNDDRPWLRRFADDGGRIILSGDRKMRARPHERAALKEAGFVVFFFGPAWDELDKLSRAATIMRWWATVEEKVKSAPAGSFWQVPCGWRLTELSDVSGPT